MIESISLKNFKSILLDRVELPRLTVLVGANGSGKSNLIKAIEFISYIPKIGVAATFYQFGGMSNLAPKLIPQNELHKTKINIDYRIKLHKPYIDNPEIFPDLHVTHSINVSETKNGKLKLNAERIVFHDFLSAAAAISLLQEDEPNALDPEALKRGFDFEMAQGPRGGIAYDIQPHIDKEDIGLILDWASFGFVKDGIDTVSGLREFLSSIGKDTKRASVDSDSMAATSLIDPNVNSVVRYSAHISAFLYLIKSIRRYDLLLNELRSEQKISNDSRLSSYGDNVPSVIRALEQRKDDKSWHRLLNTFSEIAPHILSMKPSALRTGKEFIGFLESSLGRIIESWETSDGTLRALAILLALETHPRHGTIIIEEPEQNLHPWAIRSIMEHVREVIKERDLQVIITTHSQQVLEAVYPEEVLVASRTNDGGTKFKKLEEIMPGGAIHMGEVGRLWVKGLLGGVPGYD